MKIKTLSLLAVFTVLFTGCNVQVPVGTKGKVLGKTGFQPEVYPPSKVWINNGFTFNPEKIILVETTTQKFTEPVEVLLKDKLTLSADIIFRCRVTENEKVFNSIFNDMKLDDDLITTEEIYHVYGKMLVMNTAREVISKYNVDEVNVNYARITVELFQALKPKLEGLPIDISDITIGNIQYPKIVTDAIGKAKERRMLIEEEEANVQIAITKAKGQEEVAKTTYNVKMLEAQRIRDYNKKIAEGITEDLLRLRQLEVQESMVEAIKGNANVIYMPMEMMNGSNNIRVIK